MKRTLMIVCVLAGAAPASAEPDSRHPELSFQQIRDAMKDVRETARSCFHRFGDPGITRMKLTVNDRGRVVGIEQQGDLAETPTGACIAKIVERVRFPQTQKATQAVRYPVILGELEMEAMYIER